ncbi:MAG TPA: geranylgeranyl reductase family protein [Chloroflexia bacterium]|nr:geranylgeranyl reductase family protein [Chloroflexia bacterium]
MVAQHYDALVVGAGPAGAVAAYELTRAGVRTLLIEKARLPRYKTCGGGITHKSVRALPFSIAPVTERTLYAADFSWRTEQPYVVKSEKPLVYMVQRSRFDNFLTEQAARAGAQVMDGTTLQSVDMSEHGVSIGSTQGTFSADYLVGADGATGKVARSLGLMPDRWALAALEAEVEVEPYVMDYWQDKMGLDMGELKASYGWVFPKGDHLSVGVGGLPILPDYGSLLKRYDDKHTANRVPGTAIKKVLRKHGYLLPLRRPGAPVQKGRAVLVGDAAGLVEAFTGEGIFWAIRSGQIAARCIARGRPETYTAYLDKALMPDLLSARRWMRVYVNVPKACYLLPRQSSFFWGAVCRIVRGERRFRDIGRRLGPLGFVEKLLPDPVSET